MKIELFQKGLKKFRLWNVSEVPNFIKMLWLSHVRGSLLVFHCMFGETLKNLEFETLKNLNKHSEITFRFKFLTLTNDSIILTSPVTSNFCYLSFYQLSTDRLTSKSWHLLLWFYGQKYNKREVEFMKFQTLNMPNFCFSCPINFRLSPNPHYQKFFWLIFFLKNVLKKCI